MQGHYIIPLVGVADEKGEMLEWGIAVLRNWEGNFTDTEY